MRSLKFLLQKEFRQIFRDKIILKMIIALPIIQLLIMPLASDYEIKNINLSIVDHDHSTYSNDLKNDIIASGYFKLNDYGASFDAAYEQFQQKNSDIILEIPADFEVNLLREGKQDLFVALNAINGTKASVGSAYLGQIIQAYNANVYLDWNVPPRYAQLVTLEVVTNNWFNPQMNYYFFMVPGILVLLVTMIAAYMCALNIVKEKEVGTIEQINVTPIKKVYFILGKLIPFWVIGMFVFTLGLFGIARLVYQIIPVGSVLLLYAFLAIYLVAMLGIGLLISTYSNNQQQAMSVTFFFVMIFMLMSGLFTSIDSMPEWAKWIARFNPVTYFIDVVRMILLKGSSFVHLKFHFLIISIMAVFFNIWAVVNYKKTT